MATSSSLKNDLSSYERYEDEIVELLKMPGAEVMPLPKVETLELPHQTQKPQIFVLINGGEFDEREETTTIAQLETIQGELFFRAKNRRGKTGIYATYETVKKRLLGHRIKGSKTPIYFKSFGYVSGSHNCWQYALTFSFAAYSVQTVQPDDIPAIRQITHEIKQV